MDYKDTIETEIYSEPDEKHRVKKIGMRTCGEVFNELKEKLEKAGLMPDEYLLLSSYLNENDKMPEFNEVICYPNFGGSEGIYFDIDLRCQNVNNQSKIVNFATGKTLGETTADFYKMSLVVGECSMLLNGNGCKVRNDVESILILNKEETEAIKSGLRLQSVINIAQDESNDTINNLIGMLETETTNVLENEDDDEMEE
ncbi:MAG: hypothetical protein PHV07_07905 [Oscillospiraceae bacterium]|nr:hypothetical protein [Oscillospiraceae bacterium]